MKSRNKILMVTAISLIMSSQVNASATEQSKRERPSRPSFSEIDVNADSEIDFDEFSAHEVPHGDHHQIFTDIDTDSDSLISQQEYSEHKPPPRPKR